MYEHRVYFGRLELLCHWQLPLNVYSSDGVQSMSRIYKYIAFGFGFGQLTFLPDALRLRALDALVLRPTVTGTVNGYPRVRVTRQLHNFVLARHFAAEFVCGKGGWWFSATENGRREWAHWGW